VLTRRPVAARTRDTSPRPVTARALPSPSGRPASENRMIAPELQLDLGTVTIRCTPAEVEAALAALVREMRTVTRLLRPDERGVLRRIMARGSGTLTVADVFPGFTRESEAHKTLRRLRAAQIVRPARTGCWHPAEPIEVKGFARLVWDRAGEAVVFPAAPAAPAAEPAPEPVPAEPAAGPAAVDDQFLALDSDDVLDLARCAEEELREET
jgi:hypothetical protein